MSRQRPVFKNHADCLRNILHCTKISYLIACRHGKWPTLGCRPKHRRKKSIATVVESGERERTYDGEMPLKPFCSSAKQTIRSGFGGSIRMQRVDRITFAAGPLLASVDESCRNMNEVARLEQAGRLEQGNSRGHVQMDLLKPSDVARAYTRGRTMNNCVGLELEQSISNRANMRHIELLHRHIIEISEQSIVRRTHQHMNARFGMDFPPTANNVVTQRT